jgi:hypothetical protein
MISKQHVFTVDHTSEEDNTNYRGQFTVKRLSMMDRSKVSVRKSQLNGGMFAVKDDDGKPTGQGIDPDTDWLNYMIAYLEIALIQKPEWFKFTEITDSSLVFKVFEEGMKFENSFRNRGTESGSAGSGESSSQAEHKKTDDGSVLKKVVDSEVLKALDL